MLDNQSKRTLTTTVKLEEGESVGGVFFGGTPGDYIALKIDGVEVHRQNFTGDQSFQTIRLDGQNAGEHQLVISKTTPGRNAWVDGLFRFTATAESLGPKIVNRKHYKEFLDDRYLWPAQDPRWLDSLQTRLTKRWAFDDVKFPKAWTKQGRAFGEGPVTKPIAKQQAIRGPAFGRFVNSYHGGDKSVGRLESPTFVLNGEPIFMLVAGGKDCNKVFVGLEVDGQIVQRKCGKRDEELRAVSLSTKKWKNQIARLVIVDKDTRPWGHILVDEIVLAADGPSKSEEVNRVESPKP